MFRPGDVVVLKSGGEAMTVEKVEGRKATVVWMGEEGDLFRETLPFVVLTAFDLVEVDDEEEDEDESGTDAEEDEDAIEADEEDDEDLDKDDPGR